MLDLSSFARNVGAVEVPIRGTVLVVRALSASASRAVRSRIRRELSEESKGRASTPGSDDAVLESLALVLASLDGEKDVSLERVREALAVWSEEEILRLVVAYERASTVEPADARAALYTALSPSELKELAQAGKDSPPPVPAAYLAHGPMVALEIAERCRISPAEQESMTPAQLAVAAEYVRLRKAEERDRERQFAELLAALHGVRLTPAGRKTPDAISGVAAGVGAGGGRGVNVAGGAEWIKRGPA